MNIIKKARLVATVAHAAVGQQRKYTGEPYIVHPAEVAQLVTRYGGTENQIAAAWLHDVVEDTHITEEFIHEEFGDDIASLVFWLTDVSKPEDGNRAARKAKDLEHLRTADSLAKTIKLADIISNIKSIKEHDAEFAAVYLPEKRAELAVLTAGHAHLYRIAQQLLEVI